MTGVEVSIKFTLFGLNADNYLNGAGVSMSDILKNALANQITSSEKMISDASNPNRLPGRDRSCKIQISS